MRVIFLIIFYLAYSATVFPQEMQNRLEHAISSLQLDTQFEHAVISLYVQDSKTGKPVYDRNSQAGLTPASCQKIVTSASAFELLGKDYTYQTVFSYDGTISNNVLNGNLYFTGSGDPTFGSWRWKQTSEVFIMDKMVAEIERLHINGIKDFIIDNTKWGSQAIPDGWVWQDIGNYYGAGCSAFNWHENQYDIVLKPGDKTGETVHILSANPLALLKTINELTTAAKGTGDQAYVYYSPYSMVNFLRGTVPLGIDSLVIGASSIDGVALFKNNAMIYLDKAGVNRSKGKIGLPGYFTDGIHDKKNENVICRFTSPPLDSINFWFLKKSINLYGEAFVKTIGWEKKQSGSTDTGVNIIKDFWSMQGIEKSSLKIIDGSGLSPGNRITTNALVHILSYAKKRPWFNSFYNALPEINGIKMKDGYIGGVRSYAGYIKSADGIEYTFAFIVNNFDGSPVSVREKMWRVLDLLK